MNWSGSWRGLILFASACGDADVTSGSQANGNVADSAAPARSRQACQQDEDELARAFLHWQACSKDDDCTLAALDVDCVPLFLCATAFNAQSDRATLEQEARALASTVAEKCGCSEADCPSFSTLQARCDLASGSCFATSRR